MQIMWRQYPGNERCNVLVLIWWGQYSTGAELASADVDSVFLVPCGFHCLFLTVVLKTLIPELPLVLRGSFSSLATEHLIKGLFSRLS